MGLYPQVLTLLSHWPTFFLIVGYPLFWLEIYFLRGQNGHTSYLGWIIVVSGLIGLIFGQKSLFLKAWHARKGFLQPESRDVRVLISAIGILVLSILGLIFYVSLLPPHLIQEFDALNYHLTLPRQHLIQGSFAHLPWSTADLYFLPIDFALAPFWFATTLPNKFPQFFFFIGLLIISGRLGYKFSNRSISHSLWIMCSILGMHVISIQAGTAMIDIVLCYLFVAALDSLLSGAYALSAIEFAFYFWSKSFVPLQVVVIAIGLVLICLLMKRMKFQINWDLINRKQGELALSFGKKWCMTFFIAGIVIGGPFVVKSLYYAGTPAFPFAVGLIKPLSQGQNEQFQNIQKKAIECLTTKDQYGSGRSIEDFIKHLWLIAVPEKGVNNRYDYPVGLIYLLMVGPFFYYWFQSLRQKKFSLVAALIGLYWGTWWLGSQQTRFLLIPLVLMVVLVLSSMPKVSKALGAGIVLSLMMVTLSLYGAHKSDLGKTSLSILREKDKELLNMSINPSDNYVILNFPDAAFATVPIYVKNAHSVFVLEK
jgi:hypothetical protein